MSLENKATEYIDLAKDARNNSRPLDMDFYLELAQIYATLAVAAELQKARKGIRL